MKLLSVEEKIERFNIRVYGLLINANNEVLLSKERRKDFRFTKFPGGGMKFGEGTVACLKREFIEELGLEIQVQKHFYTTDFFQSSRFSEKDQIISIYYFVQLPDNASIKEGQKALDSDTEAGDTHHFYWRKLEELALDELTFPIDRLVLEMLKS